MQQVSHLNHNCFVNGRLAIHLTYLGMTISKIKWHDLLMDSLALSNTKHDLITTKSLARMLYKFVISNKQYTSGIQ